MSSGLSLRAQSFTDFCFTDCNFTGSNFIGFNFTDLEHDLWRARFITGAHCFG